jgi:hypothetical protein
VVTAAVWVQILGLLLITAACSVMWSPWAMAVGGAILVIVPEIIAARRPRP